MGTRVLTKNRASAKAVGDSNVTITFTDGSYTDISLFIGGTSAVTNTTVYIVDDVSYLDVYGFEYRRLNLEIDSAYALNNVTFICSNLVDYL